MGAVRLTKADARVGEAIATELTVLLVLEMAVNFKGSNQLYIEEDGSGVTESHNAGDEFSPIIGWELRTKFLNYFLLTSSS